MRRGLGGVRRSRLGPFGPAIVGLLTACAVFVACILPAAAQMGDLTPEQEVLARSAEEKLVAPCCFRQALADHRSELADNMREKLRSMVADGATEEELIGYFVAKYGERILVTPGVSGFNLLAYVMPAFALAGGLMIIVAFFRRARKAPPAASAPAPPQGPLVAGLDGGDLRARMKEELDRFDG